MVLEGSRFESLSKMTGRPKICHLKTLVTTSESWLTLFFSPVSSPVFHAKYAMLYLSSGLPMKAATMQTA